MKKIILFAVAIISLTAISCKKERTCTCTNSSTSVKTYSNGVVTTDLNNSTSTSTSEKQSKKYFRTHDFCYSTTTKSTDTGTSGGVNWTQENTSENKCDLK